MVGPLVVGARVGRVVGDRLGVWTDKGVETGYSQPEYSVSAIHGLNGGMGVSSVP
jgi:hypothetical protein